MLFDPFPIHERPTLKVRREFLFDADATTVRDYLIGGKDRESRAFQVIAGPFSLQGWLWPGSNLSARYHFLVIFHVGLARETDERPPEISSQNTVCSPVEILIDQMEVGKTRACLCIETDLNRWWPFVPEGETRLHASIGARMLINWWNALTDEWPSWCAQQEGRKKGSTRDARWLMLWRRIKPLYEQDRTQQQIADQLGISRRTVSAVIAWANEHRL